MLKKLAQISVTDKVLLFGLLVAINQLVRGYDLSNVLALSIIAIVYLGKSFFVEMKEKQASEEKLQVVLEKLDVLEKRVSTMQSSISMAKPRAPTVPHGNHFGFGPKV